MTSLFKRQVMSKDTEQVRFVRKELSGTSASVLQHWNRRDVALVVWDREWDLELTQKLDRLRFEDLPSARFPTTVATMEEDVAAAFAKQSCPDTSVLVALTVDIKHLIRQFASATGSKHMEVRLAAICNDACRLFHADRMRARMVTTYRGPGTEWVSPFDAECALKDSDNFTGRILRMNRFSVGLFPGSLSKHGALVHRSPRISQTGDDRLFLCINEAPRVESLR